MYRAPRTGFIKAQKKDFIKDGKMDQLIWRQGQVEASNSSFILDKKQVNCRLEIFKLSPAPPWKPLLRAKLDAKLFEDAARSIFTEN